MIAVIGGAMASVVIKMIPVKGQEETMGTGLGQQLYGELDKAMADGMYGMTQMMQKMQMLQDQEENGLTGAEAAAAAQAEQEQAVPEYDDIIVENRGCGFNIAKHLAGYGQDVSYVSIVGGDPLGLAVIEELKSCGINTAGVKKVQGTTPIQVEMVNILGDIEGFKCNDSLLSKFAPSVVDDAADILDKADIIVMDGSLPEETIARVAELYGNKENVKIFFDPGTRHGGSKVADVLDKMYCVMPGRMEAEAMTGKTILGQDQLMEAGAFLEEKGVDRIIITMKGGGIYYKAGFNEGILRPERVLSFATTTGAGDIVSAAVVAAEAEGRQIDDVAALALNKAAEFLADLSDERPIDIYK
ncbi:MAG: PfkB family carbohydrate kinase [Lentihominibacter sp.]